MPVDINKLNDPEIINAGVRKVFQNIGHYYVANPANANLCRYCVELEDTPTHAMLPDIYNYLPNITDREKYLCNVSIFQQNAIEWLMNLHQSDGPHAKLSRWQKIKRVFK